MFFFCGGMCKANMHTGMNAFSAADAVKLSGYESAINHAALERSKICQKINPCILA